MDANAKPRNMAGFEVGKGRAIEVCMATKNGTKTVKLSKAVKDMVVAAAEVEANVLLSDGWYTEDAYMAVAPREVSCEGDAAIALFNDTVVYVMTEARRECK